MQVFMYSFGEEFSDENWHQLVKKCPDAQKVAGSPQPEQLHQRIVEKSNSDFILLIHG